MHGFYDPFLIFDLQPTCRRSLAIASTEIFKYWRAFSARVIFNSNRESPSRYELNVSQTSISIFRGHNPLHSQGRNLARPTYRVPLVEWKKKSIQMQRSRNRHIWRRLLGVVKRERYISSRYLLPRARLSRSRRSKLLRAIQCPR